MQSDRLQLEAVAQKVTSKNSPDISHWLYQSLKRHRFMGLSLGGGKTDKTCLAQIEYYPDQSKLFLHHINEKIQSDHLVSADQKIIDLIGRNQKSTEYVAVDAPLRLPKCVRCRLPCPGYEKCTESEIQWMWERYRERNKKKRPKKLFTPYTERCCEIYVSTALEEPFHPSHALGANAAPLTARAHYLQRRIEIPMIEVYPKLSLWRIGRSMNIQKSYLRHHKHSVEGRPARQAILQQLISRKIAFIYEVDLKLMIENGYAFDAFLCALTAMLKFKGEVESRPKGFPRSEGWIEFPKADIDWTLKPKLWSRSQKT